jgi:hypothetical protein
MKIIIKIFITVIFLYFVFSFTAQNVLIDSAKYIDCNTISTPFRNNGSFNRNPVTGNSGFEWPKGENKYARLASGIWLGAEVNGDTLIAMAQYASEFFSGYTDNSGNPQGKLDTLYRAYKMLGDINDNDRTKWPNALLGNSDQGAPVYFDQQNNSWKPLDFGAQTMFMSFTDYAFIHPGALNNTIITRYTIINRNNMEWNNLYIGLWTNDELGDFSDDLLACDTNLNLTYTYNGDNNDLVYGTAPPAVGFLILKGPAAFTGNDNDTSWICNANERLNEIRYKDRKMDIFNCYINAGSTWGDPNNYQQTYRILNGLGKLGTQIINPITNQPTKYFYSGDPVTGQGWILGSYGSHRSITITGPINMNPGDTQYIVFAQVIARGTSNLNSITMLRQYAQEVRNFYKNCFSGVPIGIEPVSNNIPDRFELYQNYPNPFNPSTTIKFTVPMDSRLRGNDNVVLNIYNSLGQLIQTQNIASLQPGMYEVEWDATMYSSGVYFYSLMVGKNIIDTRKMVLIK